MRLGSSAAALVALLALLISSCATKPLPEFGAVPAFLLTDQNGQRFASKERLPGKVWLADFVFTNCPGTCPRMTVQMRQVMDRLRGDDRIRLVSFSVDPKRDSSEALKAFSRKYGASSKSWYFLTGAQKDLHWLCRDVFKLGNVDGSLEHSTKFVLVDAKSQIRGYYDSADGEKIRQMQSDIQQVLRETT